MCFAELGGGLDISTNRQIPAPLAFGKLPNSIGIGRDPRRSLRM
jgi:hypothetical protein